MISEKQQVIRRDLVSEGLRRGCEISLERIEEGNTREIRQEETYIERTKERRTQTKREEERKQKNHKYARGYLVGDWDGNGGLGRRSVRAGE